MILLIDNYDSFSYNLYRLLRCSTEMATSLISFLPLTAHLQNVLLTSEIILSRTQTK